jgi:ATP-binding cassette subfamily A (ABC1) protein 3
MMTGLTTPTSGDVEIMGESIVHQPQAARRHLGYCPQANVLFGSLTVEEHLIIYSAIKGIPGGPFSPASYQAADVAIQVMHQPVAFCS